MMTLSYIWWWQCWWYYWWWRWWSIDQLWPEDHIEAPIDPNQSAVAADRDVRETDFNSFQWWWCWLLMLMVGCMPHHLIGSLSSKLGWHSNLWKPFWTSRNVWQWRKATIAQTTVKEFSQCLSSPLQSHQWTAAHRINFAAGKFGWFVIGHLLSLTPSATNPFVLSDVWPRALKWYLDHLFESFITLPTWWEPQLCLLL